MIYAKSRHDFLPKISDSLPYSGWNDVRVRKYLFFVSRSSKHSYDLDLRRSNPRSLVQRIEISTNLAVTGDNQRLVGSREEYLHDRLSVATRQTRLAAKPTPIATAG